jgi:hypothetical protein
VPINHTNELFAYQENDCIFIDLLELKRVKFSNNVLRANWLSQLKTKISKLSIISSNLEMIAIDAFNSETFKETKELLIDNSLNDASNSFVFQMVDRLSFNGLTSLTTLTILSSPRLRVFTEVAFAFLSNSLTTLKISKIANSFSPGSLLASTNMTKIYTVDLRDNNFPSINASLFRGITENVKVFILSNSKIEQIDVNTFQYFKTLQALYLQSNLLTTLPDGIFDNLLALSIGIITLHNNKWHCDCDLYMVQEMIVEYPTIFESTKSKCSTPEDLLDHYVYEADICPDGTVPITESSGPDPCGLPGNGNINKCSSTSIPGKLTLKPFTIFIIINYKMLNLNF